MVHKKYIKITFLPIALKLHQKSKHWDTFAQFSFSIVAFVDGKYMKYFVWFIVLF